MLVLALFSAPVLSFAPVALATEHPARPAPVISPTISIFAFNNPGSDPLGTLESVTIPLKRVGKLFLIEARIDNETGNFVFDTGSSRLVLNKTYFRKYISDETDVAGGITGATSPVARIRVKKLQIGGLSYDNMPADVTNLGHIENRRGVKILGLFGFSMLKNLEVVIDVNHNELRLYRVDKSGIRISSARTTKFDLVQKVVSHHDVLFVQAKVGGRILDFCLDTGAESNVLNSLSSKRILGSVSIQRRSGLVGAGCSSSDVLYGVMNDFVMGERTISNMQTIITNMECMSESYGMPIDGMLGYDFFSQGEISVNMIRKEIGVTFIKKETL
jgi:predicted aspartyl protease